MTEICTNLPNSHCNKSLTPKPKIPTSLTTRSAHLAASPPLCNPRRTHNLVTRHPRPPASYNPGVAKPTSTSRETTVFEALKFRVVRHPVRGSDGGLHDIHLIRHAGAVVVLPLLPDDRIVMIRNYRVTVNRGLWELPAGTMDQPDESPAQAAGRELEEETGYVADHLHPLCEIHPSPGVMDERILAFVATDLTQKSQQLEPTENIEVHIVPADKAMEMAYDGTITDAKTLVVLFRWNHERRNH